jgi:hypothetical protein
VSWFLLRWEVQTDSTLDSSISPRRSSEVLVPEPLRMLAAITIPRIGSDVSLKKGNRRSRHKASASWSSGSKVEAVSTLNRDCDPDSWISASNYNRLHTEDSNY